MNGARRRVWVYLVAGLGALLLLFAIVGDRLSVGYTSRLTCCVKDGTTGGGLAVARWAERLGFRTQPLTLPLWESLKNLERPTGNCVITAGNLPWSPWREDMEDQEWAVVRGWVRSGNTLIIMTSDMNELPAPVRGELIGSSVKVTSRRDRSLFSWVQSNVEAEPETSTVTLPGGGALEVQSRGDRLSQTPQEWEVAGDGSGTVWHRIPIGQGAVYLLADGFAWTNAGFDRPENTRALAALLRRELHGGVLGFDEFRHGHGRVESFGTFLMAVPGAKTFIWISVILTGLYFYGRNMRLGPPEPHEVPERRTAREYIDAVAYLYQRARAAPLVVEAVSRRFRQLALHRGHQTPEAERLLQTAEQYVAGEDRPVEPYDACELVAALVRLRKRLYGT